MGQVTTEQTTTVVSKTEADVFSKFYELLGGLMDRAIDFINLPDPGNQSWRGHYLPGFQLPVHPSQILLSMLNSPSVTQPIYFPFPAC